MWDFNSTSLWDALLWMLVVFIWIAFIFIWIRCVIDLFSDHDPRRLRQVLWAVFFIFFPSLTTLIYLIARGKSMGERQMADMAEAQAQQEKYIQSVAAKTKTPAEQIADAKALLDSGAITQQEFDAIKAKALAS